ncbi:hypothetical protein CBL_05320 [Carabus blaptoides fortunei]
MVMYLKEKIGENLLLILHINWLFKGTKSEFSEKPDVVSLIFGTRASKNDVFQCAIQSLNFETHKHKVGIAKKTEAKREFMCRECIDSNSDETRPVARRTLAEGWNVSARPKAPSPLTIYAETDVISERTPFGKELRKNKTRKLYSAQLKISICRAGEPYIDSELLILGEGFGCLLINKTCVSPEWDKSRGIGWA